MSVAPDLDTSSLSTLLTSAMAALSKLAAALPLARILQLLLFLFALLNLKSIPLTWHFRFYRSLTQHFLLRRRALPAPSHLFSPITTSSRAPPLECDVNGHKSNSTYFSDLDIARTHLVCHLTKRAFALRREAGQPVMYVALAGVVALFRKELKPLQRYEISSRVLGWDRKWVWVVSHFVAPEGGERERAGPRAGGRRVYASALTKYVFKSGRVTVEPEVLWRESGLLPPRPEGASELLAPAGGSGSDTPGGNSDTGLPEKSTRTAAALEGRVEDLLRRDVDAVKTGGAEEGEGWSWERVEEERRRGCELAQCMLGLDALSEEFREGTEEGLVKVGNFGASI
ncbi:hypothetical protein EDC01DRAFT_682687 [Geopyxis carbonaria]|nr:hypothetical protein EDC01DRAFT_682687 [Geopyxis carbonaria]